MERDIMACTGWVPEKLKKKEPLEPKEENTPKSRRNAGTSEKKQGKRVQVLISKKRTNATAEKYDNIENACQFNSAQKLRRLDNLRDLAVLSDSSNFSCMPECKPTASSHGHAAFLRQQSDNTYET